MLTYHTKIIDLVHNYTLFFVFSGIMNHKDTALRNNNKIQTNTLDAKDNVGHYLSVRVIYGGSRI